MYAAAPGRLYVAIAPDSWKARHIPATDQVAVTVLVRRGGLLSRPHLRHRRVLDADAQAGHRTRTRADRLRDFGPSRTW
jgi:hypothetical protein